MSLKENVIIILDVQEMIREFKNKYGKYPVVSEIGKKMKAEYENRKIKQNSDITMS